MADEPTVVDVDISDEDLFNEALAGDPAKEPTETPAEAPESEPPLAEADSQPRDEHGRFAPKAGIPPRLQTHRRPLHSNLPRPTAGISPLGGCARKPKTVVRPRPSSSNTSASSNSCGATNPSRNRQNRLNCPTRCSIRLDFIQHLQNDQAQREKNLRGELSFEFARDRDPARFDQALAAIQRASPPKSCGSRMLSVPARSCWPGTPSMSGPRSSVTILRPTTRRCSRRL